MSEARVPTADNLPPNPSRRRVSRAGAGGWGEKRPLTGALPVDRIHILCRNCYQAIA